MRTKLTDEAKKKASAVNNNASPLHNVQPTIELAQDVTRAQSVTATKSWLSQVPIDLRLSAAEAAIAKAPKAIEGAGRQENTEQVAAALMLGCGLPAPDALALLGEYNQESCVPRWELSDLDRMIAETARLLDACPPGSLGTCLNSYGAEVLDALGLVVLEQDGRTVLRRHDRERTFTAAAQLKTLETQYSEHLKVLFPELPESILKFAAKVLALEPAQPDPSSAPKDVFEVAAGALADMPPQVVEEAKQALRSPDLLDRLVKHVEVLGFCSRGTEDLVKAVLLGQAIRLTDVCSLVTVRGDAGNGKTQLVASACDTLPPEFLRSFSRISPKALVRRGQFDLKHVVVRGGERLRNDGDGDGNATSFVRQFVSDGYLSYEVVGNEKDPSKCMSLRVDGPTAFLETTTSENIFAEDESRMISVWLSSSVTAKHTILRRILEASQGLHGSAQEMEHVKQVCWAIHRQLRPRNVQLPTGGQSDELLVQVDVRASDAARKLKTVIALVKSHAVLHQHQRESDAKGNLIATSEDIEAGLRILESLRKAELLAKQEAAQYRLAEAWAAFQHESFEASQLAGHCEVEPKTANRWLKQWVKAGLAELKDEAKGQLGAKYCLTTAAATTLELGAAA